MKIIDIEIRDLQPIETVAVSHTGPYTGIADAFGKLTRWADANNLWAHSPALAGVYHDDPSNIPADRLRSEACIENITGIPPGQDMKPYTVSGGKYFVMKTELSIPEYNRAWIEAYRAVAERGYNCDARDHYEMYITCCNPEDPGSTSMVDIRIPVK